MGILDGIASRQAVQNNNSANQTPIADKNAEAKPNTIFGDKNGNSYVDAGDFNDAEMAKLANEKGLIGRSWDSVKDFISDVLNNGKAEAGISKEQRHNEETNENYTATLKNGQEITRTYYKEDGSVDEVINLEYNDKGEVSRKVSTTPEGKLDYIKDLDADGNTTHASVYDQDTGKVYSDFKYHANGQLAEGSVYKTGYVHTQTFDENGQMTSDKTNFLGNELD